MLRWGFSISRRTFVSKDWHVDIYDSTFGSKEELFSLLQHGPPGAVGIYANLMTRLNALEIIAVARAANWLVIAGGPEPANYRRGVSELWRRRSSSGRGRVGARRLAARWFRSQ